MYIYGPRDLLKGIIFTWQLCVLVRPSGQSGQLNLSCLYLPQGAGYRRPQNPGHKWSGCAEFVAVLPYFMDGTFDFVPFDLN